VVDSETLAGAAETDQYLVGDVDEAVLLVAETTPGCWCPTFVNTSCELKSR